MFPDTLPLHQRLLVHGDHHHLPLLASIQCFSAPLKPLASLTGLSRRQLTALMFSLPVWKVCAGGRHREQGSVSPQLPLTQYLNYGTGHLPQIPAFCQEIEKLIKAHQIQLQEQSEGCTKMICLARNFSGLQCFFSH